MVHTLQQRDVVFELQRLVHAVVFLLLEEQYKRVVVLLCARQVECGFAVVVLEPQADPGISREEFDYGFLPIDHG